MKEEIKYSVEEIVRVRTSVFEIEEIKDGKVRGKYYNTWYDISEIEPVEIGSGLDSGITLGSKIPIAASYVAPGEPIPVFKKLHFLEYTVDGISIRNVVQENDIKYIHELQRWLKENMPNSILKLK